jgi:pimeloyl-ACP methyl ester carboxylesterase
MPAGKNTRAPQWFRRALKTPSEDRYLEVERCRIHYLRWGQTGKPGLLLVHGGFAHAHWWDFIAPFFSEDYSVAALDLSGMGDSGHRPKYTGEIFANEVMSVCADAGFARRPVIVGHSFGGFVALKAGVCYGSELAGIILVDFPIRPPHFQAAGDLNRSRSTLKQSHYPTLEAALARFRLIPPQPCENGFILEHVARHSLAKVDGGWKWKFDDKLFAGFELGNIPEEVLKVACRSAVVYGESSAFFPPEIISYMAGLLRGRAPLFAIRGAHHHLFLDQPLAFIASLQSLLKEWRPAAATEP